MVGVWLECKAQDLAKLSISAGSVSLFAYIAGETEHAHLLLSTHLFRRMSSDRKYECERKSLCHTITIYNSRHEKAQWPCLVARANYSAMPLRFMALIVNFVLETLECTLSSS